MKAWGFEYKTNLVSGKDTKGWGTDGRGVGFYFRNVTELLLFGVKGKDNRTLQPGRSQVNLLRSAKREHSRKPDEFISLIEACSPGPYLEMFARGTRPDSGRIGEIKQRRIMSLIGPHIRITRSQSVSNRSHPISHSIRCSSYGFSLAMAGKTIYNRII